MIRFAWIGNDGGRRSLPRHASLLSWFSLAAAELSTTDLYQFCTAEPGQVAFSEFLSLFFCNLQIARPHGKNDPKPASSCSSWARVFPRARKPHPSEVSSRMKSLPCSGRTPSRSSTIAKSMLMFSSRAAPPRVSSHSLSALRTKREGLAWYRRHRSADPRPSWTRLRANVSAVSPPWVCV